MSADAIRMLADNFVVFSSKSRIKRDFWEKKEGFFEGRSHLFKKEKNAKLRDSTLKHFFSL